MAAAFGETEWDAERRRADLPVRESLGGRTGPRL